MATGTELRKGIIDCAKAAVKIDQVLSKRLDDVGKTLRETVSPSIEGVIRRLDGLDALAIQQGRHLAELDQRLDRLELASATAI